MEKFLLVVVVLVAVVFTIIGITSVISNASKCEAAGGTYVSRGSVCLAPGSTLEMD